MRRTVLDRAFLAVGQFSSSLALTASSERGCGYVLIAVVDGEGHERQLGVDRVQHLGIAVAHEAELAASPAGERPNPLR